jgi:peptidoglycan/xylan/chitin deacetylase (PgdA/CDA1 family)
VKLVAGSGAGHEPGTVMSPSHRRMILAKTGPTGCGSFSIRTSTNVWLVSRTLRSLERGAEKARHLVARHLAGAQRRVSAASNSIALTFDDGPDPEFTPRVLAILAEFDAKATFFLVGERVRAYPDLVANIAAAGHAVGSHSSHHYGPGGLGRRELISEYRDGRAAVEEVLRAPVPLFRPPYGEISAIGALAIRSSRLKPWLWSVDTYDYKQDTTAAKIVQSTAAMTAGEVVLLHDGIAGVNAQSPARDRSLMVEALPQIVEIALRRGLRPCRLD